MERKERIERLQNTIKELEDEILTKELIISSLKAQIMVEEININSPQSDVHSLDRTVNDGSKETKDADTNEKKIKSELYKGISAVNPQDGGQDGK